MTTFKEKIEKKIEENDFIEGKVFRKSADDSYYRNSDNYNNLIENNNKVVEDLTTVQTVYSEGQSKNSVVKNKSHIDIFLNKDITKNKVSNNASFSKENDEKDAKDAFAKNCVRKYKKIYDRYSSNFSSWKEKGDKLIEKELSKVISVMDTAENAKNQANFSKNLPLNIGGEIDAIDAVKVLSWANSNEVVEKNIEMYITDVFYDGDSAKQYFTIDDAIDRKEVLHDRKVRALTFDIVENQVPMNGDMEYAQSVIMPFYDLNDYRNITKNKITKAIPMLEAYWGYRYNVNEDAFAQGIAPLSFEETLEEQLRLSAYSLLTHTAEIEFLQNLPSIYVSKKRKTIASSALTLNDVEVIKLGIEKRKFFVSQYPDKKSLPLSLKTLEKLGIINGFCTLKDLIPSTADVDNVWCIGVKEEGEAGSFNYVVYLNSLNDIADNKVLANEFCKTIYSIFVYANPNFEIGVNMKPFGKMILGMDRSQAFDLRRNDAVSTGALSNNVYKNMLEPLNRLFAANNTLNAYVDNIETHVLSFLPDDISFRTEWRNKAWLTTDFAKHLNYLFPSNKKNSYIALWFKNLFFQRYSTGRLFNEGLTSFEGGQPTKIAHIEVGYSPVACLYQEQDEYLEKTPTCFVAFSE